MLVAGAVTSEHTTTAWRRQGTPAARIPDEKDRVLSKLIDIVQLLRGNVVSELVCIRSYFSYFSYFSSST